MTLNTTVGKAMLMVHLQPINQSINRSINQSLNQSIHQSMTLNTTVGKANGLSTVANLPQKSHYRQYH